MLRDVAVATDSQAGSSFVYSLRQLISSTNSTPSGYLFPEVAQWSQADFLFPDLPYLPCPANRPSRIIEPVGGPRCQIRG